MSIVLIGKYTGLSDAYLSVLKALQHACMAAGMKLKLTWVEAQYLEPEAEEEQPDKYTESWKQVGGATREQGLRPPHFVHFSAGVLKGSAAVFDVCSTLVARAKYRPAGRGACLAPSSRALAG